MGARRQIKGFAKAREGNFAMMFSIMLVPLLGSVALAIDYTNMTREQRTLQNATDGAALYASQYYTKHNSLPPEGKVLDFVQSNSPFDNVNIDQYEVIDNQLHISTNVSYNPFLMQVLSNSSYNIGVLTVTTIGQPTDIEVVMALDTTYSMTASDKIGGLKTAATNFTNTLFDAVSGAGALSTLKMGLVPFDQYVNVGLANRNQSWMDVPEDTSETTTTDVGCRQVRDFQGYSDDCETRTYMNDGVEESYEYCEPIYGPYYETCEPVTTTSSSTWRGCVGTRGTLLNELALKDTMPSAIASEKVRFPGMMNVWCAEELMPLTYNRTDLLNKIASFTPSNNTYIADGVMWAQRVLSPQAPFTEGVNPATSSRLNKKIMIVMTDGENQNSPRLDDYPDHWGTDVARADTWTQRACNYAKQQGTTIYTVSFGTQVPISAKNLMKRCATNPANFYDAASSASLNAAFQEIASDIVRLRLTQ